MGLNKTFISDESLLSYGSKNFENFHRYLTKAECFITEGEYAPGIFDLYSAEKDLRENIWKVVNSKYENKEEIIKGISRYWKMINDKNQTEKNGNPSERWDDILNCSGCPSEDIKSIISILKEKK